MKRTSFLIGVLIFSLLALAAVQSPGIHTDLPYTRALLFIDYPHHEQHGGKSFTVQASRADSTSVLQFIITTPASASWAHLITTFFTEEDGIYSIIENPTVAAKTGTTTAYNRNRNSGTAAAVVIHSTANTLSGGTTIWERHGGNDTGAAPGSGALGEGDGRQEFILKQNEEYWIKCDPVAKANASLILDWYEHTNVNQ